MAQRLVSSLAVRAVLGLVVAAAPVLAAGAPLTLQKRPLTAPVVKAGVVRPQLSRDLLRPALATAVPAEIKAVITDAKALRILGADPGLTQDLLPLFSDGGFVGAMQQLAGSQHRAVVKQAQHKPTFRSALLSGKAAALRAAGFIPVEKTLIARLVASGAAAPAETPAPEPTPDGASDTAPLPDPTATPTPTGLRRPGDLPVLARPTPKLPTVLGARTPVLPTLTRPVPTVPSVIGARTPVLPTLTRPTPTVPSVLGARTPVLPTLTRPTPPTIITRPPLITTRTPVVLPRATPKPAATARPSGGLLGGILGTTRPATPAPTVARPSGGLLGSVLGTTPKVTTPTVVRTPAVVRTPTVVAPKVVAPKVVPTATPARTLVKPAAGALIKLR